MRTCREGQLSDGAATGERSDEVTLSRPGGSAAASMAGHLHTRTDIDRDVYAATGDVIARNPKNVSSVGVEVYAATGAADSLCEVHRAPRGTPAAPDDGSRLAFSQLPRRVRVPPGGSGDTAPGLAPGWRSGRSPPGRVWGCTPTEHAKGERSSRALASHRWNLGESNPLPCLQRQ